ncbi:MAG TPA: hypothetical protein VFU17_08360 [Candidatus Limnocylindrales bacterium]|nr:hypothetical protein [Candidatus Limnocylindrales bacterium]
MTFHYDASHHQSEREHEAEHARLVRAARAEAHQRSSFDRAREALGLGIVGLGLALGGDGARRRAEERPGPHSVAV